MAIDVVQEIKQRTDLVELISAYVALRPSGRSYKGLCPFHAEKTPSFHVDRERGFFKCYGCGVGGDCFRFIELKEGLSFSEAGELLARRLGLEWVRRGDSAERRSARERLYDLNALVERFYRQCLERAPEVREYLRRRGLEEQTIQEFRLGYAPGGYEALLSWLRRQKVPLEEAQGADLLLKGEQGWRDRFVERVIFPISDVEGRPVAFGGRTLRDPSGQGVPKYLNTRETPIFQKGRTLYGLHLARRRIPEAGFAVAVEGYMDLIALHQAGIANAVATLGTALTETHVGILGRYSRELVMCYDGDSAGMRAAERSSAMFEAAGCQVRVARLPAGSDPDAFLREQGADAFRALLARAEPLLEYQLTNLRAAHDLTVESQRLPFVREAARIIAQSTSFLVRQEYASRLADALDRLAQEWYPGDPHRALQARMALTLEVNRLLRTEARAPSGSRARPPVGDAARPENGASAAAAPGARARAERYALRAALAEYHWAERLAERLTAAHFTDAETAPLAAALLDPGDPHPPGERAARLRADPAHAQQVSSLLMERAPLSEDGFLHCLGALERAGKEARLRVLQRERAQGAPADFPAGDPRRDELLRLLAELGGRHRRED